jgi:hypothetical protein
MLRELCMWNNEALTSCRWIVTISFVDEYCLSFKIKFNAVPSKLQAVLPLLETQTIFVNKTNSNDPSTTCQRFIVPHTKLAQHPNPFLRRNQRFVF